MAISSRVTRILSTPGSGPGPVAIGARAMKYDPAAAARATGPELHRALLAWFALHRRDLPWRRRRSLYGTWISEMMLQQTTVATVTPYWERFVARFPDVKSLAAASPEEVLALWSGLGYYRRARQLHAAAVQVVSELGGELPRDLASWRALPGVGPYAAGAIVSIGLGVPEPAVDANVRRVLTRLAARPGRGDSLATPALEAMARALVPGNEPGPWNEALMELGATVCTPRNPACPSCPLGDHCGTRVHDLVPSAGTAAQRPEPIAVDAAVAALVCRGRIWLEAAGGAALVVAGRGVPVRDDFSRLHEGLLTLPMSAWHAQAPRGPAGPPELDWRPWEGLSGPLRYRNAGSFRHAITRFRLTVAVLVLRLDTVAENQELVAPEGRPAGLWVELAGAGSLHVSQLARKALGKIGDGRG